jgi:rhodanese-related sulfurtransferase
MKKSSHYGYIDISPQYAWELLNDPSPENGIQIPIDVRADSEWQNERIRTPFPEHPRHFSHSYLKEEQGLQEFASLYNNSEIVLYCLSGTRSANAAYLIDHSDFVGVIYNIVGGISEWKMSGFPVKKGNDPPYQPDPPSGPTLEETNVELYFITQADDPNDDPLQYGWDWNGDDIIDEITEYYLPDTQVENSHIWEQGGIYNISVVAIDYVGALSEVSQKLSITINNPPEIPIITGPAKVNPGKEYTYKFTVTDSDEDDLYIYIEWGDDDTEEWIGPLLSGEEKEFSKTWNEEGTYLIRAKVKDGYEAESDWASIEISVPKIKKNLISATFINYILTLYYKCPIQNLIK